MSRRIEQEFMRMLFRLIERNVFFYIDLLLYWMMEILHQRNVWIVLSGYLIILSQSSGMFVGFAVFLTFFIWRLTGNQPNNLKYALRVAVILLLFVSLLMLFSIGDLAMLSTYNGRFSGLRRLLKRISSGNSLKEFAKFYIKDRSLTRVVENPFGFIYGTGEGMWTRYTTRNEIHATMISLCFYYGIIPYSCWIIWLRSNMKSLHPALLCVYVAQIAEAFTLANHRQPFFWIMFVLASSIYAKKDAADLYKKSNIDDPIDNCILR